MKQTTALDILKTGQNVFLTGQAGAGKTYVLNQYIRYLRHRQVPVAITASTGIASTHMNGMTVHAWSGMGIKDVFDGEDFKKLKKRQNVLDRLLDTKVLIVDEISMLHAKQVELLDEILRTIRDDTASFGGVQVVFSGDFFQLPPVGKKGETNKEKFAFMSNAWKTANFQVCYLTEQHRQTSNDERERYGLSLNDILNQIRNQDVEHAVFDILLNTKQNNVDVSRTQLYTHNVSVDKINLGELAKLTGDVHEYTCSTYGDQFLVDGLKKNVRTTDTISLKVGAKVMFVKNNTNLGVYNGTMGEVVDFATPSQMGVDEEGAENEIAYPVVRLNTGRQVLAEPDVWTIEDNAGVTLAGYTQVPLCLAWAITIHKSQGMTLDAAEIDLSTTFEPGQGYVALSRLRSLDGLKLLGLSRQSLLLDEWVYHIDKRLQELTALHEENFNTLDSDTIAQVHKKFISACGGTNNLNIITQNENTESKLLKQQAQKQHILDNESLNKSSKKAINTIQETKKLFLEGLGINEVAEKRSLAISTIINHLAILIKQDGTLPYQMLSPTKTDLEEIQNLYNTLESKGVFADGFKLKPFVDEAGKDKDYYNTVRLALAFLQIESESKQNDA